MWGFEEEFDNDEIVLQQKRNGAFSSNNHDEETHGITHQPVRSRGRIAEVLAQARASLKEPSRPFTPASLDARTSNIKQTSGISAEQARLQSSSLYGHVYGAISKTKQKQNNHDSYQAQPLKAASSALINSSKIQNINDTSNKLSLSHTPQDENTYNYNDFSSYSNLSPEKNTSSNNNNNNGHSLQIVILDLQDNITLLETATLPNALLNNNENESYLNRILNNLGPSVEKIAKSLKGGVVLSQKIHSELNLCISEIARLLTRVVQSRCMMGNIKQLACRHILRLYLSKVARITSMGVDDGVQPTIPSDISSVILSTLQSMYQMCGTDDTEESNVNTYEPDANNDGIYEIEDENPSMIQSTTMSSSSSKNDVMLSGGIDIILDLLSQIWSRLPNDFKREVDSDQTNGQGFMILLESAVYAAGILRIYSNDETNRRRLLHLGAIENIGEGLKVSGIIANYRLQLESQSVKLQTPSISSSSRMINIFDKLSQILVQLVAAERNFALDSQGRLQIQTSKSICVICNLFRLYKTSPELLLNCARVTAKLSLQEPFRSQINSKPVHIKCLVDAIIGEAQHCQKIMDGDNSNIEEGLDTTTWPSWYTWPLLSRISFTLGNLTTTNDSNRTLIGIECKVLKPLVVLLRACAGSLSLLYAPKTKREGGFDENSNSDEEYENEDNESNQSAGEQELSDATVKLLRLLANLCIDGVIGISLAKRGEAMEMLVELLTCSSLSNEHEELLLNVVATATNLSFYACQPNVIVSDPIKQDNNDLNRLERGLVSLTKRLANSLFHENDEVVLEASRALGNLTRSPVALVSLRQSRTDEALGTNLFII
jgi:hypothetical protein